jgi:hypothetical protein
VQQVVKSGSGSGSISLLIECNLDIFRTTPAQCCGSGSVGLYVLALPNPDMSLFEWIWIWILIPIFPSCKKENLDSYFLSLKNDEMYLPSKRDKHKNFVGILTVTDVKEQDPDADPDS